MYRNFWFVSVYVNMFIIWGGINLRVREGDGTLLQYSCLKNPMDGGAWWTAVQGVTKNQTRLSDFTFTFHFHALEEEMENPRDRGAWWAAVYGAAQSRTQLKQISSSSSSKLKSRILVYMETVCLPSKGTARLFSKVATPFYILTAATAAKSLQLCPTLCNPIDGSPPGFPIPGILQARTLEWVAISFSNA